MKKQIIAALALMACVASVHAQGQVNFGNKVSASQINAIVKDSKGAALTGPTYNAALYVQEGANWVLVPNTTTPFRTGAAAGYISSAVVSIPGHDDKASVTLQMGAFDGASYDAAAIEHGFSNPVTVTLGGGLDLPPDMVGLNAFSTTLVGPEPSTIALGLLGAAGLFLRRRK
jgi:hypothetical protein